MEQNNFFQQLFILMYETEIPFWEDAKTSMTTLALSQSLMNFKKFLWDCLVIDVLYLLSALKEGTWKLRST